jgi:hypothetical protein
MSLYFLSFSTLLVELFVAKTTCESHKSKALVQGLLFILGLIRPDYVGWGTSDHDFLTGNQGKKDLAAIFMSFYVGHVCFLWYEFMGFASKNSKQNVETTPSRQLMFVHHLVTTILVYAAYSFPKWTVLGAHLIWLLSPSEAMLCIKHIGVLANRSLLCDGVFVLSWIWGRVINFSRIMIASWTLLFTSFSDMLVSEVASIIVLSIDFSMQVWWSVEIIRRIKKRWLDTKQKKQ